MYVIPSSKEVQNKYYFLDCLYIEEMCTAIKKILLVEKYSNSYTMLVPVYTRIAQTLFNTYLHRTQ